MESWDSKQAALGYLEMAELNLKIANNEVEEDLNVFIKSEESNTGT